MSIDTIKIDFHLSYYQTACHSLTNGVSEPKEIVRLQTIRDASLCAIALEANIISEIGTGKLDRPDWENTISWIKQYQRQEVAA